jgi:hypothetical protein
MFIAVALLLQVVPGTSDSVSSCRDTVYAVTVSIKARRWGHDDDEDDDDDHDDDKDNGHGRGRNLLGRRGQDDDDDDDDKEEDDDSKMYAPCSRVAAYLQVRAACCMKCAGLRCTSVSCP